MSIGILRKYYSLIGRPQYISFPIGLLILNWIVQRLFRINSTVPVSVHYTNKIQGWENCKFEDESVLKNLTVSGGAYITVFDNTTLEIGKGTIWAFNICIQTGNHIPGALNSYDTESVKIGMNCWLGNGVTILKGVTLGNNVVVGANAVVTKSFPDNVIIAGIPAKVIKVLEKNS